jgi:enoyl-CoA hydratase/carnithine racemase
MTLDIARFQPKHFQWQQEGRVGIITLNRPERKNPLTFESYAELRDFFRALVEVREVPAGDVTAAPVTAVAAPVRAIVITGSGGNFCSGGDVHEIIGPLTRMDAAGLRNFTQMTGDLVKAMRACPQPIVAAVDGVCAGAGAILAMSADFRLGTARAKTAFLFTRVGLAGCDMGACAILPRIIGQGRASELLFTGRSMTADEGLAWGFFNRLIAPETVLAESITLATQIATGPTFAHAMTKKMLHAEWAMTVDAAIDAEAEAQAVCMETKDFQRAYHAFVAKQKPKFAGD